MEWDWIKEVAALKAQGIPFAICTVCETHGSTPREIGAKMVVLGNASITGTIGGGRLEFDVIRLGLECLQKGETKKINIPLGAKVGQCCGGSVQVLIESFQKPKMLFIFGAGHVGKAVCESMTGTEFQIHLIDEREALVLDTNISNSIVRHSCEWQDFVDEAEWNRELTYAVVMTHRHDLDEEIISALLSRPTKYLGLIGSRSKWARFRNRLTLRNFSEEQLNLVRCPIGIGDLGKSPKAVAISLAAEILTLAHA